MILVILAATPHEARVIAHGLHWTAVLFLPPLLLLTVGMWFVNPSAALAIGGIMLVDIGMLFAEKIVPVVRALVL
jgi:hypothetical protein